MKFDSNLAWKDASSSVATNRDVLLALAGVFFLLPSLAFSLLMPAPQPPAGATPDQIMTITSGYYAKAMPFLLPMTIIQAAGTLGMLALLTDRRRPTVGEAIKLGFQGLLPYIGAQMLTGLAIGLVGMALIGVGAATGSTILTAVLVTAVFVAAVYAMVKTSLTAPVIMVEGVRNPITALTKSWHLTKGNSLRIGVFYLLVALVFVIAVGIIMAIIGVIATLILGSAIATIVSTVISSALAAVMTLYFVAIIVAVHRQLSGDAPEVIRNTFN